MNGTKKTLTTLTAAAAMALGGIAIAQTDASTDTQAGAQMGSSSTLQNESGSSTLNNDTSTLGAGSSTLGSDSTMENQSSDGSNMPVAQMDRG